MNDLKIKKGDFVIATKYSDGDPNDHFAVGYFQDMNSNNRFNIVDENGKLFRGNGFRKAKKVSKILGNKIIENIKSIEQSNTSVWKFVNAYEKNCCLNAIIKVYTTEYVDHDGDYFELKIIYCDNCRTRIETEV